MWSGDWRNQAWTRLGEPWDLVVVGGGITGAGILHEASQRGRKALLLEQRDFAWGASSRSSKLVHGGLRYLKQGKLLLTAASARERERLLADAPGLVEPLGFLFPAQQDRALDRWLLGLGLSLYDHLAGQSRHSYLSSAAFRSQAPHLAATVNGGYRFLDAHTDDARLVLRLLQEAGGNGALAINAVSVSGLLRAAGRVAGVVARDALTGRTIEVQARAVVNAAGPWSDRLRAEVGAAPRIRPLRGSHLVFPAWRLPVAQALTVLHPADRRPVVIAPWEGATLVGTTDRDHLDPLDHEPHISAEEFAYLIDLAREWFPSLDLGPADVVSTFAGVRPVVGSHSKDPTCESRDHVVWNEAGLLTVTGGKLTTFRLIAADTLSALGADGRGAPLRPDRRSSGGPRRTLWRRSRPCRLRSGAGCWAATGRRPRPSWPAPRATSWPSSREPTPCGRNCAGPPGPRPCSTSTIFCCGGCAWGCCCPKAAFVGQPGFVPSASPSWAGTMGGGSRKRAPTGRCGRRRTRPRGKGRY